MRFTLVTLVAIAAITTIGCETEQNNTNRASLSGIGGYGPTTSSLTDNSGRSPNRELGMSSGHNVRLTGGDPIRNRFRKDKPQKDVTDEFFEDIGDGFDATTDFLFGWID